MRMSTSMTPETKFELLKLLLESGIEVRTLYKNKRVVALERPAESTVLIRYENGEFDKMRLATFAKRRFVVII